MWPIGCKTTPSKQRLWVCLTLQSPLQSIYSKIWEVEKSEEVWAGIWVGTNDLCILKIIWIIKIFEYSLLNIDISYRIYRIKFPQLYQLSYSTLPWYILTRVVTGHFGLWSIGDIASNFYNRDESWTQFTVTIHSSISVGKTVETCWIHFIFEIKGYVWVMTCKKTSV